MKLSGQKLSYEDTMLTSIYDSLNVLLWSKTKDGQKNRNRPKSLLMEILHGKKALENDDLMSFETGEEFEKTRNKLLRGGE